MNTKRKIAVFKELKYNYESVCDEQFDTFKDYVRLTEFVEVEFPPLQSEEIVQKQLDALDMAESELRNRFQEALGGIERQREELRAITYKPAA
jgi:hypothetical protein